MKKAMEWVKEKWDSLDKNKKIFICGVVILIIVGALV